MKILLVYPPFLEERPKDYDVRPLPIGIYYIAALLKERGYAVEILNWFNLKDLEVARRTFRALQPEVIGFSIFNANRWGGIDLARVAREVLPEAKIVFGGVGATFLWEHLLTHFPEVDYVVRGEGEHTFLRLVEAVSSRATSEELQKIPGLALRLDGKPHATPEADFIPEIDDLPDPARYFSFQHVISSRVPLELRLLRVPGLLEAKGPFPLPGILRRTARKAPSPGCKFLLRLRRHLHPAQGPGDQDLRGDPQEEASHHLAGHLPRGRH